MNVFIKLIIKVFVNNQIKLFCIDNKIPIIDIAHKNIENNITLYCKENFNFLETVCAPTLLSAKILDGNLLLYYTFYYPKDFIDEKNINSVRFISNI